MATEEQRKAISRARWALYVLSKLKREELLKHKPVGQYLPLIAAARAALREAHRTAPEES